MKECTQVSPSKNKEFLMTDTTNRKNIEVFSKLMEWFFYSEEHTRKITDKIAGKNLTKKDLYINKMFKMNEQGRAWFDIDTMNEAQDSAYKMYRKILFRNAEEDERTGDSFAELEEKFNISHFNVYKRGKVTDGKQVIKLFRLLLNKGLLSQEDMDIINSTRTTTNNKLYICVSRNPIDYLVSASNQSFTSCESLNSNYHNAYYMGLPGLVLDTNRVIIFLTNGTQKSFILKEDFELKHFNYACRSWAILTEEDILYLIRYYPSQIVDFVFYLNNAGYKLERVDQIAQRGKQRSKFDFELPILQDGQTSSIYFDSYGPKKDETENVGLYFYNHDGLEGAAFHHSFNWSFGFEKIKNLEIMYKECIACGSCSEIVTREESKTIETNEGPQSICKECFNKKYIKCTECGKSYSKKDKTLKYGVCDNCITTTLHECCSCGSLRHLEEVCYIPKLNKFICKYCIIGD